MLNGYVQFEVQPSFYTGLCEDPDVRMVYYGRAATDCESERLGACDMYRV